MLSGRSNQKHVSQLSISHSDLVALEAPVLPGRIVSTPTVPTQDSTVSTQTPLFSTPTMTSLLAIAELDYGFTVTRGVSWAQGGHGDQDGGTGADRFGRTVAPDENDLKYFLDEMFRFWPKHFDESGSGQYWVTKTIEVKWDSSDESFYYRAGDEGAYDLQKSDQHEFPDPIEQCKVLKVVKELVIKVLDERIALFEDKGTVMLQRSRAVHHLQVLKKITILEFNAKFRELQKQDAKL